MHVRTDAADAVFSSTETAAAADFPASHLHRVLLLMLRMMMVVMVVMLMIVLMMVV